jgi:hypothetical protein
MARSPSNVRFTLKADKEAEPTFSRGYDLKAVRRCPSGSRLVLDCANDRREYGATSASGDHL